MPNKQPPVAPVIPHEITQHGETRIDDYFWMREKTNPAVIAYIEAENAYVEQTMAHTQALQEQLYAEMRGRIKETDLQVPEQRGLYFYYTRHEAGREYPLYCRKHGSLDAEEELVLDHNGLAEGHEYCRVGIYSISPDQRMLAYSVDYAGDESYTLLFKNLETGETLADRVSGTYYGVAWASDNRTIFYTVLDAAKRPYKLFRHTIGTEAAQDTLVYHEADEAFFLNIRRTRSGAFLLLEIGSTDTSEVRAIPADQPHASFFVIQARERKIEYKVEHHGDRFLIVTNHEAQNFKLVEAPISNSSRANWRELIAHRDDVLLDGVDAFRHYIALYERRGGLQRLRIADAEFTSFTEASFPEPVYTFEAAGNLEFDTTTLRFNYSSLVTPNSVIDYDMQTQSWELKKRDEIPSGYDASLYVSERLIARAADGADVPISLVYRKGLNRDERNPTLLYGYGAYGIVIEPDFASKRLSLLDRGFVFAIAHIRGGDDMGRAWYEQGKLLHKKNTFTDFIACAEHLIAEGYTSPDKLAINGRSAGGLLMGAVTNMRPDLFKAVIAGVPFVDVVNTMSDPTLPLTVTEYDQWGNPADPIFFEYMKSYSPYDNVEAKNYPNLLITSGLNDPRVSYWEPSKWAAKLRSLKTDGNVLLLKTNMQFGHFGASGRFDHLKEDALEYAFLIETLDARRD